MAFRFNEASKDGITAFAEDYQVTELSPGRCIVEWTMAMQTAHESAVASEDHRPDHGRSCSHGCCSEFAAPRRVERRWTRRREPLGGTGRPPHDAAASAADLDLSDIDLSDIDLTDASVWSGRRRTSGSTGCEPTTRFIGTRSRTARVSGR